MTSVGPVHARDALRHGERLARAGHAEQHLRVVAAVQPLDELVDRARLIAAQLEIGDEVEAVVLRRHGTRRSYHTARRPDGPGAGLSAYGRRAAGSRPHGHCAIRLVGGEVAGRVRSLTPLRSVRSSLISTGAPAPSVRGSDDR